MIFTNRGEIIFGECIPIKVLNRLNEWSSHSASIFNDLLVRQQLVMRHFCLLTISHIVNIFKLFGFSQLHFYCSSSAHCQYHFFQTWFNGRAVQMNVVSRKHCSTTYSNVQVTIASHIDMFAIEYMTVHLEMMNMSTTAFRENVLPYSNAVKHLYVYIIMSFVMVFPIVHKEMTSYYVTFQAVQLNANV